MTALKHGFCFSAFGCFDAEQGEFRGGFRGHCGEGLEGFQDFRRDWHAAFSVTGVDLVFVASRVKRAAPSGVTDDYAVMLECAEAELSSSTSARVDVGATVTACLQD